MISTPDISRSQIGLARWSGAIYLAFVVIGAIGFLVVRPDLFSEPSEIGEALGNQAALAGVSVALELTTVFIQAALAWALFALFRLVSPANAAAMFGFGLVSATALLVSAAMISAARVLAISPSAAPDADTEATAQTLVLLSASLWESGGLFFGLWLIPLGLLVLKSGWMPRVLGWVLVIGGTAKVASSLLAPLLDQTPWAITALTVPQNIAEFWLVGYLLIFGVRTRRHQAILERPANCSMPPSSRLSTGYEQKTFHRVARADRP